MVGRVVVEGLVCSSHTKTFLDIKSEFVRTTAPTLAIPAKFRSRIVWLLQADAQSNSINWAFLLF